MGEYPEAHGYAALRAYAQPIVSGQRFVPVDSEFERAVYRSLLETRRLLDKAGVDLVIEKPLFDRLTQRGACRPDFLLEARSRATGEVRQLIVEAMGFVSDDYLAAKAVTHPRMELIAPILSVSVEDVDRAAVPSMIRATLRV